MRVAGIHDASFVAVVVPEMLFHDTWNDLENSARWTSGCSRAALVDECERAWTEVLVSSAKTVDLETRRLNQSVHLAIQMATAADSLPHWGQPILPVRDCQIGRASVLHKKQLAFRFENTPHLQKRGASIGN